MGKYLITGRGGCGKSTVAIELQRRGFTAFDGDRVPGLARWQDRKTGEPIEVDTTGYVDFEKVAWAWDEKLLKELVTSHEDLFLCGSSSNQEKFYGLFDGIFVLQLDPETHDYRLRTRKSDYGKHPELRRKLIAGHQVFAQKLISEGALPVNAVQPIEKVVSDILEGTN